MEVFKKNFAFDFIPSQQKMLFLNPALPQRCILKKVSEKSTSEDLETGGLMKKALVPLHLLKCMHIKVVLQEAVALICIFQTSLSSELE